ncbi:MAG: sigma-54-dependent Fis family transcriptional regulator [Calditrichaceae bacterium]|nr:sigma-54-dependent Fis family transcriptional regulator [Calditrichaceae bacterium]MBN2708294.1 sigma-54-dependent Fis family transcriptional regulator [Calditrichaceae bacterium]RQV91936.1 MAG: sigma-54-dependent Fis family transcriptional regulator [Calditrichota bacterium]
MSPAQSKILIIEDNIIWQQSFKKWLGKSYVIEVARDVEQAKLMFVQLLPDIVVLDLGLPQIEQGFLILDFIINKGTDTKVIVITASQDHQNALKAQNHGASSYFFKSEDIKDELPLVVKRALQMQSLERENRSLRKKLSSALKFDGIVSTSKQMQNILKLVEQIKNTPEPVLITGESGSGKEVIARHIHFRSKYEKKPFIAINSAALPENLLENELFGHEKGAFTGANETKKGQLEMVKGGTLFLDEIGELSPALQAKLLRVLQEKKFYRLGGTTEYQADFRLITATNRNLNEEVKKNKFREDLYYRLNVIPIKIPPLRERPDDIPALIELIVDKYCKTNKISIPRIEPSLVAYLSRLEWKGNVRQLENTLIRMLLLRHNVITLKDLPEDIQSNENHFLKNSLAQQLTLEDMNRLYVNLVYDYVGKNKKKACEFLKVNYRTLESRLKK